MTMTSITNKSVSSTAITGKLTRHFSTALGFTLAASMLAAPAHAAVIDDAVVYYDFEGTTQKVSDQSGTTAIDLTLGANNTADNDDPTRGPGKFSSGLTFDGDDVASSGSDKDRLDFNADDPFSVAGWFRRDDATGTSQKNLLTKMDPSGSFPGWFLAWRDNDNNNFGANNALNFFMRDDEGGTGNGRLEVFSDEVEVKTSEWVHIAVTYEGGGDGDDVSFFVNGSPVGKSVQNEDLSATDTTNNTAPFNLGGRDDAGSFFGAMDNVGVWDRVLTQNEIQTLAIPEPATAPLIGVGGVMLLSRRRRG